VKALKSFLCEHLFKMHQIMSYVLNEIYSITATILTEELTYIIYNHTNCVMNKSKAIVNPQSLYYCDLRKT